MKTKVICKWLLIVSSLLFSVVSYIFGYSFSSTNYNSFLLAASKYENGQYYTHVDIDYTESSISYDDVFAITRSLYGKQESINPYLKTKNQYDFKLSDFNFTSNICSAYVYSDKKKMECLPIQLYHENSTIASGPKNGANFAAYISSSIADSLIDLGLFNSFDDILQSDIIFSAVSNDSSYSFSINNIYLNNESEHWSREEDLKNNLFRNHFASWNKDAIFSYCPELIRMDEQVLLSSDIRGGYGNLDCLSKSAIMNTSKNISITLHHNGDNKTFVSPSFSKISIASSFGIKQAFLLIAMILPFSVIVILSLFVPYIYCRKKLLLLITFGLFFVLFASEVIKTVFSLSIQIYSIFNSAGNILMLLIIGILSCSLIFRGKHENTIENNHHSISI